MKHRLNNQAGLTIIEMMITMTLGLLLINGLIQVLLSSKQTYRTQLGISEIQENGRFTIHKLSSEIRMAGYMGCNNVNSGLKVNNNVSLAAPSNGYSSNVDAVIQGFNGLNGIDGAFYDGATVPTKLSNLGLVADNSVGSLVENSDALIITRAKSCPGGKVKLSNNIDPANANIVIESNAHCKIQQNDIVMVSNCRSADIFGVSNKPGLGLGATISHGANWNNSPLLKGGYGPDSEIYQITSSIFYIGVGSNGSPSFFKRELKHGAFVNQEMVNEVESLSISYGEDLDGDNTVDVYAAEKDVTDMKKVLSVKFSVVTRSRENLALTINNGDKKLRKEFDVTVVVRNRSN